ncbi:unnamed protein product [Lactuca virosa]|uniref:Uncharacterized protein n=1 Tax=Lactuca virosa TaxID=75947 RepID=A0AAU9LXS8_9ASTR|nr:unnamed protein product [Lactuca virosa]
MTLGDQPIADYCERITTISNLLAKIDHPVPERTLVTHLLNGLLPKYDHIAMILCQKDPLPTLLQARSKLIAEEHRLNRQLPQQPAHSDHSSPPTVLYNSTNSSNTNFSHGGRHGHGDRSNRGSRSGDLQRHQYSTTTQFSWPYSPPWAPFTWMYLAPWTINRPVRPAPSPQ